jgi:hypothetical protein
MAGGFALIAWPALFASSGIMTSSSVRDGYVDQNTWIRNGA